MIRITHNGRDFDPARFAEELAEAAIEEAMKAIEEQARGAAGSIIDPETGRHADVFVDRLPGNRVAIRTSGSQAFARLLEQRLGVDAGEVEVVNGADTAAQPKVYLAHASEDKAMVRPIAEFLMANGVDVWFDEWEIEPGDSLRVKMEEGLGAMTHFVVVLTATSITKPWVSREIDVGLVRLVGGESRLVPLVVDLDKAQLPLFLQTMLFLKIDPADETELKGVVDRLYGVSRKPALGPAPRYVEEVAAGLAGWSPAAVAVGRYLVEASEHGMSHDPIVTMEELAKATGLTLEDTRIAVLDLKEAGYLWEGSIADHVAAEGALFVEFDAKFMPFDPASDARIVANRMVTGDADALSTQELAGELGWEPRRMNSAVCYLLRSGVIEARHALASVPWRAVHLIRTDRSLRFARNNA